MNTITGGIRRNSACPTALRGADGATLHGVNTIAEVFVNDTLVGKCDDMMIEHRFRVEKRCALVISTRSAFTFSPQ